MIRWQMVIVIAMLYVSIVTPYEVSIIEETPTALDIMNWGVDSVFLIDMCLQVTRQFLFVCFYIS